MNLEDSPTTEHLEAAPWMRNRDLVATALVGAIICCGAMALIAGLVGGVALAAIGRFTAVSIVGLGVVVAIAWWLDRRRHRHDRHRHNRTCNADDRLAHCERTLR